MEHLPAQGGYDDKPQPGQDPSEDDEPAEEFPSGGFRQFVRKFFVQTETIASAVQLVSDNRACWRSWVCLLTWAQVHLWTKFERKNPFMGTEEVLHLLFQLFIQCLWFPLYSTLSIISFI